MKTYPLLTAMNRGPLRHATFTLGTILPTPASESVNERFAEQQAEDNAEFAANCPVLSECERRTVGGEVRYYQTPFLYATVRHQKARWFEVRDDGDYAVKGGAL